MIRIMVVEDEIVIAKSIRTLILQYNTSIDVVKIALNGKSALEFLENENVDIIFTDIKMPVMDGITLLENVNILYPNILVIILSGFREFEYAKKAIKYGVFDYLSKPISKQNLNNVLDRAIDVISKRDVLLLKEQIFEVLNYNTIPKLQNNTTQNNYFISIINIGQFAYDGEDMLSYTGEMYSKLDLLKVIQQILGSEKWVVVSGKSELERILVIDESIINDSARIFSTILETLKNKKVCHVTMVYLNERISFLELNNKLSALRKILKKEAKVLNSNFVSASDYDEKEDKVNINKNKKDVMLEIKINDIDTIYKSLYSFINICVENEIKQVTFLKELRQIAIAVFENTSSLELEEIISEIEYIVSNSYNMEDLANELKDVFYNIVKFDGKSKAIDDDIFEKISIYIIENYKTNITLKSVSKHFGISTVKLSKGFKKFYNMSLSEYLNSFRIEMAKSLMDRNEEIMIKEIAFSVGFNDQYYFSKTFRKITGLWPTEYSSKTNNIVQ